MKKNKSGFPHGGMPMLLLAFACAPALRADVLDDIKPGEWYEAPGTQMLSVQPVPAPPGNSGVKAVMSAWNGGAYDTKRDQLIVWGGGHGDYSGNEIYTFSINTLKWTRVTDPSTNVGGDEASGIYPDGRPRSRHTYNYIQYVPAIDRFCTFGGAAMYSSGGVVTNRTHCFDFEAKRWEEMANSPAVGIGAVSDVDPATGHVWVQGGTNNQPLAQWDPKSNAWKRHFVTGWFSSHYTAAAGLGRFVAIGSGKVFQWSLSDPMAKTVDLATSGENDIIQSGSPGFVFDPKRNYFMAWNGGATVYALDLPGRRWVRVPLAATNQVTPTPAQRNGTYGRFRYIPSRDLYIAVNSATENVFFFRMPTNGLPVLDAKRPVPLQGRMEFDIFIGRQSRHVTLDIPGHLSMPVGARLDCRIFSTRREVFYAQGIPSGTSGRYRLSVDGNGPGRPFPSGAYFLRISRDGSTFYSRPFRLAD